MEQIRGTNQQESGDTVLRNEVDLYTKDITFFSSIIQSVLNSPKNFNALTTPLLDYFTQIEQSCLKAKILLLHKEKSRIPQNINNALPLSSLRSVNSKNSLDSLQILNEHQHPEIEKLRKIKKKFQNLKLLEECPNIPNELTFTLEKFMKEQNFLLKKLKEYEENFWEMNKLEEIQKILKEYVGINKSLIFVISNQFNPLRQNQFLISREIKKTMIYIDQIFSEKNSEIKFLKGKIKNLKIKTNKIKKSTKSSPEDFELTVDDKESQFSIEDEEINCGTPKFTQECSWNDLRKKSILRSKRSNRKKLSKLKKGKFFSFGLSKKGKFDLNLINKLSVEHTPSRKSSLRENKNLDVIDVDVRKLKALEVSGNHIILNGLDKKNFAAFQPREKFQIFCDGEMVDYGILGKK